MNIEYIPAKTMLSPVKSSDKWFTYDYNMNIYRGCCHGCIYCDSRSECYHIEDFDRVRAKADALSLLQKELKTKRKRGVVASGAMSDPYNPLEKELKLTRGALELLAEHQYGAVIFTKSDLVTRDIDVLTRINQHQAVLVCITVTTADDELSHLIEPNVGVSSKRLAAIKQLTDAGIFAGILMTPMLPFLTDSAENVRNMIHLAKENGAKFIYPMFGVTLRSNQREYYYQQLDKHFPGLKRRYIEQYHNDYYCNSPDARSLWKQFGKGCQENELRYQMKDIVAGYLEEDSYEQLNFLENWFT